MKKLVITTILGCCAVLAFAGGNGDRSGNGNVISIERPLPRFNSVVLSSNATVNFHESPGYRAVITVDSNLAEHVKLEIMGGVLNIETRRAWFFGFTRFTVDIYCPALTGVSVSGSGNFNTKSTIIAPTFRASVSGSGNLNGTVECDSFLARVPGSGNINMQLTCDTVNADISGSGKIFLAGTGRYTNLLISGSGDFMGSEFKTDNAAIRISGSGNTRIWVTDDLKARVSGSGNIRYRGTPKIDFRGSGSGSLLGE